MPVLSMLSVPNVATPPAALTIEVPDNVPPAGLVPIATLTLPVNPVTRFPSASRALTCTAGTIARPAVVAVGWVVKTSWLAGAGVMLNALLVAPLNPLAVAVRV